MIKINMKSSMTEFEKDILILMFEEDFPRLALIFLKKFINEHFKNFNSINKCMVKFYKKID